MSKLKIKGPVMDDAGRMYRVVVDENRFQLARFYGRLSLDDAKLFIAAPELLAALEDAKQYIWNLHQMAYGKAVPRNNFVMKTIEAAIKRAEGDNEKA